MHRAKTKITEENEQSQDDFAYQGSGNQKSKRLCEIEWPNSIKIVNSTLYILKT